MVPAKFRQCRRPHQNQSPRSRRHRTRCHRPGRLQITMITSNLSRQLLLTIKKLPPTKSTVSLILTDSGNSPDVKNMFQNRWIVFPSYLINGIYDVLMFILLTVRLQITRFVG